MSLAQIRITTPGPVGMLASMFAGRFAGRFAGILPLLSALLVTPVVIFALSGCGASANEIQTARNSGYETEFATVYSAALSAVQKDYPHLDENASAGVIKTSWHPVRLATEDDTYSSSQQIGNRNQVNTANSLNNPMVQVQQNRRRNRRIYFVRFRVSVVGGDPWRVSVVGEASEWAEGNVPSPLHGANVPPWLAGRVNALRVRIHKKLAKYAVALPSTARKDAPPPEPEIVEVDQSHLGSLPPKAVEAVVTILGAAKERDYKTLEKAMNPAFTWSLGADPNASQALMMWQADSSILDRLIEVLEAGCALETSGDIAVCPSAVATAQSAYEGYRARFAKNADGTWSMTSFVGGN